MRGVWILVAALLVAGGAIGGWFYYTSLSPGTRADPRNAAQVAMGVEVYVQHCARCHGDKLEGERNWMQRKASGRLPAPPHDASGHTWHHPDSQLFGIVKNGITPYAPPGYQSDMPTFGSTLSDEEVWAVLAYIKSSWPEEIRERQQQLTKQAGN